MNKTILLALAWAIPLWLSAQLTLQLSALPENTPPASRFYLAGNFNNWNAADNNQVFARLADGRLAITVNPAPGLLEFKITRGSWETVEGTAEGGFISNRIVQYDGKPQTVSIRIAGWEDRTQGNGIPGSAAPNVFVLDDDFTLPQLQRKRRIWIFLPPDYAFSQKRYPVLYMHDGQNLFDNSTSSFGEWRVDESLNEAFNRGDYGCIVVGIDNGSDKRLDEYSPWKNPEYGGGEGKAYLDFITQTLKPFVDATYRTLPGCETTGIMGSSMGGLISQYALSEAPEVFCRVGVLSPAFWFARQALLDEVRAHPKQNPSKVYFLAGGDEPDYVEEDIIKVGNALLSTGFQPQDIYMTVPPDGQHSEWFWSREFPAAYTWLFTGTVPKDKKQQPVQYDLRPEAGSSGETVRIPGVGAKERLQVVILGAQGKIWTQTTVRGSQVPVGALPAGEYCLYIRQKRGTWRLGELIR